MMVELVIRNIFYCLVTLLVLAGSVIPPGDQVSQVRSFTRSIEFDYVNWTLDALLVKNKEVALDVSKYMDEKQQTALLLTYLDGIKTIDQLKSEIEVIFSDPSIQNPMDVAADRLEKLKGLQVHQQKLAPFAEAVVQQQVTQILSDMGITLCGQAIPPVLYHMSQMPLALIISPREVIRQDANISLLPEMTMDQIVDLESKVEKELNVSALVERIGGIGVYPTMVMSTTDPSWLVEVVAHEWTHNFLTLRPLGVNYETTPELRTMNETAASIAGNEIGAEVIRKYYPEFLPPTPAPTIQPAEPVVEPTPPAFDFNTEMHITRVSVDELLLAGKIDEAESYMESRRQVFWQQGYLLRRLNQAYFAFHGAYADVPGGAAGVDPVGPAVRQLRKNSYSLSEFLNRISWMDSFEDLQKAVK
jgi:hypothetical protein